MYAYVSASCYVFIERRSGSFVCFYNEFQIRLWGTLCVIMFYQHNIVPKILCVYREDTTPYAYAYVTNAS